MTSPYRVVLAVIGSLALTERLGRGARLRDLLKETWGDGEGELRPLQPSTGVALIYVLQISGLGKEGGRECRLRPEYQGSV